MKRINLVSAVMVLLLLVFSDSRLEAQVGGYHVPGTHKEPGTSVPGPGQQEILLGVYKLDKALLADLLEDNALQIFIQLYLLRSSAFEVGKSLSTLPAEEKMLLAQNCMLIKGNLLLVMATAQQQEQIAAFLKKLEAACEKTIAAKQDVEIETVVVKTPEGRMEYGVPKDKEAEVFYTGGLLQNGMFPIPRDFDLDVFSAVSMAGGVIPAGGLMNRHPTRLLVIREVDGYQQMIRVDMKQGQTDPCERILIQPNDLIVLEYTPMESAVNLFLSMLPAQSLWK